jgi:hypothetical protein
MHEKIEQFYKSILEYAGLKYDPDKDIIVETNNEIGEFKVNGKYVTLPYKHNLKHPNGRMIMHPLNENFVKPESSFFLAYKKRLTVEINLKISELFNKIIEIASEPRDMTLIKNVNLIKLFSSLNEVNIKLAEDLANIIKRAIKEHEEGFIVDFILNKNSNSKFKYASAVGFVKFNLYKDIVNALENKEYRLYKYPISKRNMENLKNIHEHIFTGNLDEDYWEQTENKRFRYLTILLKTSYLVASTINKYIEYINTDLNSKGSKVIEPLNTDWVNIMQDLYDLDTEIRLIPNQDEYRETSEEPSNTSIGPSRLNINEDNLKNVQVNNTVNQQMQQPIYTPQTPMVNQPQQTGNQQSKQPLDPLQILKQPNIQQPYLYQQPMQTYQPQAPIPYWMQRELMASNMQQVNQFNQFNQVPIQQPGMINQVPIQQPIGYGQFQPYQQMPNMGYFNPNVPPMFPYMQQPRYTAG